MKKLVITLFCMALLSMASKAQAGWVQAEPGSKTIYLDKNNTSVSEIFTLTIPAQNSLSAVKVSLSGMEFSFSLALFGERQFELNTDELFVNVSWGFDISVSKVGLPSEKLFEDSQYFEDNLAKFKFTDTTSHENSDKDNRQEVWAFTSLPLVGDEDGNFIYNGGHIPGLDLEEDEYIIELTFSMNIPTIEYAVWYDDNGELKIFSGSTVGADGFGFDDKELSGEVIVEYQTITPEPATLALLGLAALGGLPLARRLRRK